MVKETKEERPRRAKGPDIVTRDMTIHMSKLLYGVTFKNRAPRAVREIKAFVQKAMKTTDIRIADSLNKHVWSQGIKGTPKRIRIRVARHINDDEKAKEKLYVVVSHVPTSSFKGLETENVVA